MKKRQLDHVLRAPGRITGETQFIVVGSQSLHGQHPDLPDQILLNLSPGETGGVRGHCLDPHELAISKYVAARDKDRIFNRELVRRRILKRERLLSLLRKTPITEAVRSRIRDDIAGDFARA